MRQEWYCENCNTLGAVRMPKRIDAWGGSQAVTSDHAKRSPRCNDASKIRIRAPQCSEREWSRVTRRRENQRQEKAADRLLSAVGKYVDASGGNAVVAGGIGVMDYPNRNGLLGPDPLTFYLCIQVTGRRPKKLGLES